MKSFLVIAFLFTNIIAHGQDVHIIVRRDRTFSTMIKNGNTATIVEPNGTHSTVISNEKTAVRVNPNGTHSLIIRNGNFYTAVNLSGSHSTIIDHTNSFFGANTRRIHCIKNKRKSNTKLTHSNSDPPARN